MTCTTAAPPASTLDFLDVDRIEVLRGPQGTLYGKNTTAGAINITTRKPTFEPEATTEITTGNLGFYQAKAAVSGPLIGDSVAGRLAVSTTNRRGTLFNTASAQQHQRAGQHRHPRPAPVAGSAMTLDVTLSGDYNKQNAECCGSVFVRVGTTQRAAASASTGQLASADRHQSVCQPACSLCAAEHQSLRPGRPTSTPNWTPAASWAARRRARCGTWVPARFTSVSAWRYWDWGPKNDRDFTGVRGHHEVEQSRAARTSTRRSSATTSRARSSTTWSACSATGRTCTPTASRNRDRTRACG